MATSIQIRREVERLEARGRGIRYPAELRAKLIGETWSRREAGGTLEAIGEELGVAWRTLARWCAAERKSESGFRSVEIMAVPSTRPIVHGPCGLRIEGLDVEGIAELVRRLA